MNNLIDNALRVILLILTISFLHSSIHAQTPAQNKQIEDIAQEIAIQHNRNSTAMIDEMTVSTRAVAVSKNVIFEYVIRVKKGLSESQLKEYQNAVRHEIVPGVCIRNQNNPAFDRGLFYTFVYFNTYGEKLAEIVVNKTTCERLR